MRFSWYGERINKTIKGWEFGVKVRFNKLGGEGRFAVARVVIVEVSLGEYRVVFSGRNLVRRVLY